MTAHEIIIRPIVSERSFSGMELNKYTFEVAKDANKYQIKDAVEEIFGVKVVRVNTLTVKPKTKRVRYVAGKTRHAGRGRHHRGLWQPGLRLAAVE